MMSSADAINAVQDIQSIFTSLPASTKPRTRDNGKKEWTVLSAIFLWKCTDTTRLECVSIGTGLKALPSVSICPHGDNLHDMHAEVIARRGFLRWLLVQKNCISKEHSWLELNDQGKCKLRSEARVGLYSSTLPCGDASMSLLTHKDEETPVPTAAAEFAKREYWGWSSEDLSSPVIRGRIGYSGPFRGKLRTKPGRLDSLPTYSMSCSDKILGWSIYGVQGKALSRWFEGPIFIDAFVFEVDDACISKEQVMESLWGRGYPISQYPSPSPQPAIFLLPPSFLYSRLNTKDAVACNEFGSKVKVTNSSFKVFVEETRQ
ncbi:hypothetical protein BT69DRAFT_593897 [Atractiella rhizophila]|nr:hypothetical protein BT69DRAFT_593897 [Atractiella rhizophila]